MATTTLRERLAEYGDRIAVLEARAKYEAGGMASPRIRRHLAALRREEEAARAVVRLAPEEAEERLGRLATRIEVAEHALTADLTEDRERFVASVTAELHGWDTYLERLQTTAAARARQARERAEAEIGDVRRRRMALDERLTQARDANGSWREQRERLAAARDELEQKADELSAKLG
jgi:chromosome segregation ATPase